ncbi:PREDICTED: uncharacterized protein LOC109214082 [Nicotiana attenuata]|uniref:uncharacterized protein LOC109214082 n=1 Tax=Nicotiana attenuata TaxID=49451 RepID=UPI0009052EA1|nr:PREDICTED: uncharacterized protein LOC109214082 [Nicotiana attenuata]
MVTVRSVIAVVASKGWNIYQMDVYNAFLQGDLYEEVYMDMPQGFQANLGKSFIYFGGVTQNDQDLMLMKLGFTKGVLLFKYLGVPLSTKKLTIMQWQPLIEKIVARITSRITKKLSYAGRGQLISSVLFGVQSYWAQLFILPAKVMKAVEDFCRSYLWTGNNVITRKSLINWDRQKRQDVNKVDTYILHKRAAAGVLNNAKTSKLDGEENYRDKEHCRTGKYKFLYKQKCHQTNISSLAGDQPRIPWKCLMFGNAERPKTRFTLWLQMLNRLLTADRLNKWGMEIESSAVYVRKQKRPGIIYLWTVSTCRQ